MPLSLKVLGIAVFPLQFQAHSALMTLQRADFTMRKLSIVGQGPPAGSQGGQTQRVDEPRADAAHAGASWGTIMNLLSGSAMFYAPAIGHLIVAGPLATALFATVSRAAFSAGPSAFARGLVGAGIPWHSVMRYEAALKANKFILAVHGDTHDIRQAREQLIGTGLTSFQEHHITASAYEHAQT